MNKWKRLPGEKSFGLLDILFILMCVVGLLYFWFLFTLK